MSKEPVRFIVSTTGATGATGAANVSGGVAIGFDEDAVGKSEGTA